MNFCEDPNVLSVISLVKDLLNIISIAVPIILIIMVSIDLTKMIINTDEKATRQSTKSILNRTFAAVALFFIPSMVNLLMDNLNVGPNNCWANANASSIAKYKVIHEARESERIKNVLQEKEKAAKDREKLKLEREKARKEAEKTSASSDSSFGIRTVAPTASDIYYTNNPRGYNGLISQCPWYAMGRTLEILDHSKLDANEKARRYSFVQATFANGGQIVNRLTRAGTPFRVTRTPTAPAVVSWQYTNAKGQTYGHTAVVEKIENGQITFTDSSNKQCGGGADGITCTNGWHNVGFRNKTYSISEFESIYGGFQGYVPILE